MDILGAAKEKVVPENSSEAKQKVEENIEQAKQKVETMGEKIHHFSESLKRRLSEGPSEPFEAHGEDIEADMMATSKALYCYQQECEKREE